MQNFRLRMNHVHCNMAEPLVFSGGEVHVDLSGMPANCNDYDLRARCQSGDDIMHMLMMADALDRRYPDAIGSITIPYIPYARQDRMCADGQHFGMEVFGKLLRQVKQKIVFYDIHSIKGFEIMYENVQCKHITQAYLVQHSELRDKIASGELQVVAPDKGARDKAEAVALKCLSPHELAIGSKTRDPESGKLTGFTVDIDDFNGQDVLICDDICDGGGTFLGLAEILKEKNCGSISLYVTHGIFSKGFDLFSGVIDTIYTTDSFRREHKNHVGRGMVADGVRLVNIHL